MRQLSASAGSSLVPPTAFVFVPSMMLVMVARQAHSRKRPLLPSHKCSSLAAQRSSSLCVQPVTLLLAIQSSSRSAYSSIAAEMERFLASRHAVLPALWRQTPIAAIVGPGMRLAHSTSAPKCKSNFTAHLKLGKLHAIAAPDSLVDSYTGGRPHSCCARCRGGPLYQKGGSRATSGNRLVHSVVARRCPVRAATR